MQGNRGTDHSEKYLLDSDDDTAPFTHHNQSHRLDDGDKRDAVSGGGNSAAVAAATASKLTTPSGDATSASARQHAGAAADNGSSFDGISSPVTSDQGIRSDLEFDADNLPPPIVTLPSVLDYIANATTDPLALDELNAPAFDIVFAYTDGNTTYSATANSAAAFWELAITADMPDIAGVDDLRVDAKIGLLGSATGTDGTGNTLANAGPTAVRSGSFIAYTGQMGIDPADVGNVGLEAIIIHEVGHVLGIPYTGRQQGWITDVGIENRWSGTNAVAEYRILSNNAAATYVRMQDDFVDSTGVTRDGGHWIESEFGTELMTPSINTSALAPLSRMTLAALRDLGYTVDLGYSDPFWLASTPVSLRDDRSGNYHTTTSIGIGSSSTGSIELVEDNDWYRVNLVSGSTYTFEMKGSPTSSGTLTDAFLKLRAADGEILSSNDNNGTNANALIQFTATATGLYYLDASAASTQTGTYSVTTALGGGTTTYSISPATQTVTEGNTSLSFTITRTGSTAATTIYASTLFDTATSAAGDYTGLVNQAVAFAGGATTATVNVQLLDDTVVESQEHFRLMVASTQNASSAEALSIADIYINDNDSAASTLSISAASADKSEGNTGGSTPFTFTVTRTGSTTGSTSVDWNIYTGPSPTVDGADFANPFTGTVSFAAGETTKTITINVAADTVVETDENFQVGLLNAVNGTIATGFAAGVIRNDDSSNTVDLVVSSISLNDTTLDASQSVNVIYTVQNLGNTAVASYDVGYYLSTDSVVTNTDTFLGFLSLANLAAGASTSVTGTFTVPTGLTPGGTYYVGVLADDLNAIAESNESNNASPSAAVTINSAAPGSIAISDVTLTEGNAGTKLATFTVTRTGGTAAFAVNYTTADAGATTANNDYLATSGVLNFAAGVNAQTISVTINGDTTFESDEAFFTLLSGATNGATIADGTGIGTIQNDDPEPVGSITISDLNVVEGNSGSQFAQFVVTRTGGTAAFSVNYATSNGTATAGSDYGATSGVLNFAAGVNSQTINVLINSDTTFEPNETYFVNLSGATNGAVIADAIGAGGIINDDAVPNPAHAITAISADKLEGNIGLTNYTFRVTRSGDISASSTVVWTATSGTAPAADVSDIYDNTDLVFFAAGQATADFDVQIYGDTTFESDENFIVALSNATGGTIGAQSSANGIIRNDDVEPVGSVTIGDVSYLEGDSGTKTMFFTLNRSGGSAPFSINYATANGTAIAGVDYIAASGTATFGQGQLTQSVSVTLNGDTTFEPDETLFLNLSGATNGATIVDTQGQGTIQNDDAQLFTENADTVTLGLAGLTWHALGGADNVTGSAGNDSIFGDAGDDTLNGGGGADALNGDTGNDVIFYDAADDLANVLGGADFDTLVFTTPLSPATFGLAAHQFEKAEGRYTDTGANAWTSYINHYDIGWLNTHQTGLMDNGQTFFEDYDELGTESWIRITYWNDSLQRPDVETGQLDDGRFYDSDHDNGNLYSWSRIDYWRDALARSDVETGFLDDGRSYNSDLDNGDAYAWDRIDNWADSLGRLDYQNGKYDADDPTRPGWSWQVDYDQANQFTWSRVERFWNSAGVLQSETFFN